MTFPTITVTPGRMTEAEARRLGAEANRMAQVRTLRADCKGGSLTVTTSNGTVAMSLASVDVEALLELLMERSGAFLTAFDVALDSQPSLTEH